MFNKILIANRGEIAVRIIRACREMGIRTVAVYSEADRDALHTQLADEAVCIGKAQSSDSYLNMERILSATIATKAEAIHPGFGFLSENSRFVEMCEKCNVAFIGPSAEVISRMGNKSEAKNTMRKAKVPVVPGTKEPVYTVEQALEAVKEIGFPVMIKVRKYFKYFSPVFRRSHQILSSRPFVCSKPHRTVFNSDFYAFFLRIFQDRRPYFFYNFQVFFNIFVRYSSKKCCNHIYI